MLKILNIQKIFKPHFFSIFVIIILEFLFLTYLNTNIPATALREAKSIDQEFLVYSAGFKNGQAMPKRYTADGSNLSPELTWTIIPNGTKSFAILCEDPDAPAGTWIHWIIYDIPASKTNLPKGIPAQATLKDQTKQGINSFRHIGYGGPSPPPGLAHRYFFRLYALNDIFGYESTINLFKFRDFVQKHKIAETEIIGLYGR
jgi:Raf kinase inhibitor-like YbhB/YbcL family protein